jgi:hypothetical protein
VKIIVTDCLGAVVADLNPRVWLTKIDSTPDQAVNEVVSSSAADTGNQMRFAGPHYIYNLSTKLSQFCPASMCSSGGDLTAGTYELKVTDPRIAPVVTQLDFRN